MSRRICFAIIAIALGGCMSQQTTKNAHVGRTTAVVRYQTANVGRAIEFYTARLGFQLDQRSGDAFAAISRGDLHLLLGGPGSSGSRPMPDGRVQTPGGWNRILLYVSDLDAEIARLREADVTFRNDVESGPGGKQIQIEDPDGNPIELHQAAP
jgi:glyoxylase I family protein